jgi:hypothetical protein
MTFAVQSLYTIQKKPTSMSYYGYAYTFYFKGFGPLERHLPVTGKS